MIESARRRRLASLTAFFALWLGACDRPGTPSAEIAAQSAATAARSAETAPAHEAGRVTRLTDSGATNGQPALSPDGRRIAFVSDREDGWQIWTMPAAGGPPERMTHATDPVGWPSWSPDDRRLLYYTGREGRYRLRARDLATGADTPLPTPDGDAFRPTLDADGRRLLFDAVTESSAGHDLFVLDVETGGVARLTDDPGYDSDARWSPDGSRIVFHSDREAGEFSTRVFVMASDGSDVRRLTEGPAVSGYPAWSPDGTCIAYTSELDGNRDLWLIPADGGTRRRLTTWSGFDGDPIWHPDGAHLLFATDRFGGTELALLSLTEEERDACGIPAPDAPPGRRSAPARPQDSAFSITGDTFVAIQVADDVVAARWYADLFGLAEVNHLAAADGRFSIRLLTGGGLTVELIRLRGATAAAEGPKLGLFKAGFWVDDIDAAHAWLVGRGVDADDAIFVDEALSARSFVFRDVEGNRLQVFQRCPSDCE